MPSKREDQKRISPMETEELRAEGEALTPAEVDDLRAKVEQTNKGRQSEWRPFQEALKDLGPSRIKTLWGMTGRLLAATCEPKYRHFVPDITQSAFAALLQANPLVDKVRVGLLLQAAKWRFGNDYRRGGLFVSEGRRPLGDQHRERGHVAEPTQGGAPEQQFATSVPTEEISEFPSIRAERNARAVESVMTIMNLAARADLTVRDRCLALFYLRYPTEVHAANAWTAKVMTAIGFPMTAHQVGDARVDLFRRLRDAAKLPGSLNEAEHVERHAYRQLAGKFDRIFEDAVKVAHAVEALEERRAKLDRRFCCLLAAKAKVTSRQRIPPLGQRASSDLVSCPLEVPSHCG
jgi:hypothetical protein